MRIGMIGAESKHVEFFGGPINKEKLFEDTDLTCIWGGDTTPERLKACTEDVGIGNIMKTPSEVIDHSDAVIIILRNGNLHAKYAVECINKHKPVFIDKPFTCNISDALSIINAALREGTPYTGGSTLCFLPEICELNKLRDRAGLSSYEISYRADPYSPYGGWYFYGSHLTDLCASIFGTDAVAAEAKISGSDVSVDVFYPGKNAQTSNQGAFAADQFTANKKVRIYSAPQINYPSVTLDKKYVLSDEDCYKYGLKAFFNVISEGSQPDSKRLLFSVRLMDAIMKSISTGKVTAITE